MTNNKNTIHKICDEYDIVDYSINHDGSINVVGPVSLTNYGFTTLPLKFNIVHGHFFCNNNKLTTLDGSPRIVHGVFNCCNNNLTTLVGGPEIVHDNYQAFFNHLTSLKGCPSKISHYLNVMDNPIRTFKYVPKRENVGEAIFMDIGALKSLYYFPSNNSHIHFQGLNNISVEVMHMFFNKGFKAFNDPAWETEFRCWTINNIINDGK